MQLKGLNSFKGWAPCYTFEPFALKHRQDTYLFDPTRRSNQHNPTTNACFDGNFILARENAFIHILGNRTCKLYCLRRN